MLSAMRNVRLRGRAWLDAGVRRAKFVNEFLAFRRLAAEQPKRFALSWGDRYPCLSDNSAITDFDRHYVYHTAWAARVIRKTAPQVHVDISSSLFFSAIVSSFCPVRFYDHRPANLQLTDLETNAADLLSLPFADASIWSLSCMHVAEHVGLGRYGDALDPNGDLKAMAELKRVLAPGGNLLFVVPIGKPRVMFNAHRIYRYEQIRGYFDDLELREFALIPDHPRDGGLVYHARQELTDAQTYACGCFWFSKSK
jgi:SAM-dependent methyltransferase